MFKFLKIFLVPIFILTSYCSAQEYSSNNFNDIIKLTTNKWQYRLGDSQIDSNGNLTWLYDSLSSSKWKSVDTFKEIPSVNNDKYIWVRTVLPNWEGSNPSVYVDDIRQAMQVYLDNKKIYQFGNFDPVEKHIPYGYTVHLIPLPENFQGKTLFFRIYSSTDKVVIFKTVSLGRSLDLTKKLFFANIDEFILASIYIIAGIIILLSFIFLQRKKLFLGLSIFLMALGLWTGSNSQFLQLILKHSYLFYFFDNVSISSLAIGPFIIAENIIEKKYKRILRRLWQLNVLYLFTGITIELIPGTSFADLFNYYLIILFILSIVSTTAMIK